MVYYINGQMYLIGGFDEKRLFLYQTPEEISGRKEGDRMLEKEESGRLHLANELFLDVLMTGEISSAVKAAYDLFEAPVVVVDSGGRSIGQYPKRELGELQWDEFLANNMVSVEKNLIAQEQFRQNKKNYDGEYGNIAYITDPNVEGVPYIMGEFFEERKIAGHFGILIRNREISEIDLKIAKLFGKVLNKLCSENKNRISVNLFRKAFLLELLRGSPYNKDILLVDRETRMKLQGNFLLMVCPTIATKSALEIDRFICDYLYHKFDDLFVTIYDEKLVILCCKMKKCEKNTPDMLSKIQQIIKFLNENNYVVSISKEFADLEDVKGYFAQTVLTLEVGKQLEPDKKIYKYDSYEPLQMFCPIAGIAPARIWFHPTFLQIKEYDEEHNTEYLDTMIEYLICGKNKKEAAKRLNIHINTMNYRIGKIDDLFDFSELTRDDTIILFFNYYLGKLGKE